MPTYLVHLHTARENVAAQLATLTAEPKPSYSIDGQSVSWQALFDSYVAQLAQLDARIAAADPYEFTSRGVT